MAGGKLQLRKRSWPPFKEMTSLLFWNTLEPLALFILYLPPHICLNGYYSSSGTFPECWLDAAVISMSLAPVKRNALGDEINLPYSNQEQWIEMLPERPLHLVLHNWQDVIAVFFFKSPLIFIFVNLPNSSQNGKLSSWDKLIERPLSKLSALLVTRASGRGHSPGGEDTSTGSNRSCCTFSHHRLTLLLAPHKHRLHKGMLVHVLQPRMLQQQPHPVWPPCAGKWNIRQARFLSSCWQLQVQVQHGHQVWICNTWCAK